MAPALDQAPRESTPVAPPRAAGERDWNDPLLTCLSLLTGLLELPRSVETLRAGLPLHENRMTPDLFVRAATRNGFAARAATRRRLDEISPLNLPCALVLHGGEACVLVRFVGDQGIVVLPESGGGVTNVSIVELQRRSAGTVLFIKPRYAPDERSGEISAGHGENWFWSALLSLAPIYGHVAIAAVAVNLLGLAGSLYAMNVYDRVVPNHAIETLWVLTAGVLLVYVFDFLLRQVRAYFVDAAGKSADAVIASRLFEHVMSLRLEARPPSTGALANNLREYESLREFFTSATLVALIDLPFAALFVLVAYLLAGPAALVALIAFPLVAVIGFLLQLPLQRAVERNQAESTQKHAILVEAIEGIETLKVAGAEGRAQRMWERFVGASARSAMASRVFSSLAINFTAFATNVSGMCVILFGVGEIAQGKLTMGALIAATILTGRAMAPLGQIAALMVRVNQSFAALRGLNRLMAAPREREPGASFVSRPALRGQIEFNDVSFAYPPTSPGTAGNVALSELNLFIAAGERVGIVGRIGSGKSTLARLIAGLYRPSHGSVLVDGTDLRQIDPTELRRQIGYVPQDSHLFFGTVRDNIVIGWPNADDDAILRAATIAGVDDFVKSRPQGYDLPVGERGQYLSGGQRSAVALARALLADPPVLLLDEPTGWMDSTSEQRFKARLQQATQGRTLIVITHRGSMLSLVDRLIVVDQGRIVADGPKQKVVDELAAGTIHGARGAV
jgi:ATP-binding cassette subfamily C protein LapB